MSSFGNITALAESPRRPACSTPAPTTATCRCRAMAARPGQNVTSRIAGVPKLIYVSRLTPSAFAEGTVYASFDGHRSDDFKP